MLFKLVCLEPVDNFWRYLHEQLRHWILKHPSLVLWQIT
jgi:hypothetical protein